MCMHVAMFVHVSSDMQHHVCMCTGLSRGVKFVVHYAMACFWADLALVNCIRRHVGVACASKVTWLLGIHMFLAC